ncbi:unnamed protein product, partial [Pylaiella littoralis]
GGLCSYKQKVEARERSCGAEVMAFISEDRVDLLEEKMRSKIDTMTGFSDVEGKSRALEKVFKYFDIGLTGRLDYNQFFAAMTRLNFVGVQRELESLFDRYDEDCSNTIDYKHLCDHIFEMGEHIAMNSTSRSLIERASFKTQIFERGGVSGLRGLREHLESMDPNGSGLLERSQLIQGLTNFGIDVDDGPGGDIEKIMGFFDRDAVGRIVIHEFHRGLRGNMPKRRQLVVKDAFERLSANFGGCVTTDVIQRCYDPASHPDVASGRMSPDEAFDDILSALRRQDDNGGERGEVRRRSFVVFFCDFMDYFRDLSAAIENDEYFQAVTLNAWVLPARDDRGEEGGDKNTASTTNNHNSSTDSCRALVAHPDGLVVIENGRGIGAEDHELMRKRLEEQGVHDIASVSLCDEQ